VMHRQARSSTQVTGRRNSMILEARACHVPGTHRTDTSSRTGRRATTPKPCPSSRKRR
jgi:hypothetical protein